MKTLESVLSGNAGVSENEALMTALNSKIVPGKIISKTDCIGAQLAPGDIIFYNGHFLQIKESYRGGLMTTSDDKNLKYVNGKQCLKINADMYQHIHA